MAPTEDAAALGCDAGYVLRKWTLCLSAVVAAGLAFGAPAAGANHEEGFYSGGATGGGGQVEFSVVSDSIAEFAVTDVLTSCGYVTFTQFGTPITLTGGHPFSYGGPGTLGLRYSGSFPAAGRAQGTLSWFYGGCTSAAVGWTATLEGAEGGGDRKRPGADARARKKCKKIKSKRKRKKCLKRAVGKR